MKKRKKEEGRKVFEQNLEENQREEKTIPNRRFSPAIIPPLTVAIGVIGLVLSIAVGVFLLRLL